MFLTSFFSLLLMTLTRNRSWTIRVFYLTYLLLGAMVVFGAIAISTQSQYLLLTAQVGKLLGISSVFVFFAATFPGILGRFRLRYPLITLGMAFRRYIGILSFLLGLSHALLVYIVAGMVTHTLLIDIPVYAYFGALSLFLLFLLFLTSNDWSVKTLGKKWKLLHKLVYIIYWIIFLHVMFQEVGPLAFLIGACATLEVMSLLYDAMKVRESAQIKKA